MCGGVGILFNSHQLALGGPRVYHRLASQAGVIWSAVDLNKGTRFVVVTCGSQRKLTLTDSGLSVGFTRWPSNRNRTLCRDLPCRSQKASINFLSWVVRLILKKTSLFESVTLMFRCSGCSSGFGPFGEPESDILISTKVAFR
jgi:hypothetical protein